MDEATKLLSATCDTFIKTLEECMKLSSANIIYELPQHNNDVTLPPAPINVNSITKKVMNHYFKKYYFICYLLLQNNRSLGRLNSSET